eukprot:8311627-Ditylum_brightwellii.AAC.1
MSSTMKEQSTFLKQSEEYIFKPSSSSSYCAFMDKHPFLNSYEGVVLQKRSNTVERMDRCDSKDVNNDSQSDTRPSGRNFNTHTVEHHRQVSINPNNTEHHNSYVLSANVDNDNDKSSNVNITKRGNTSFKTALHKSVKTADTTHQHVGTQSSHSSHQDGIVVITAGARKETQRKPINQDLVNPAETAAATTN